MKCDFCGEQWPPHLVTGLFTNEGLQGNYDPICALKLIRQIHGDPSLVYQGEQNKANYADAKLIVKQREVAMTAQRKAGR
jgi:hypothetical protein